MSVSTIATLIAMISVGVAVTGDFAIGLAAGFTVGYFNGRDDGKAWMLKHTESRK